METPWAAERVVDQDLARTLIRDQFPEIEARELVDFGSGWDNTAYLVDGVWVFRFPRRSIAVALLESESNALPLIARLLPLAVPEPIYVGRRDPPRFDWPFAGYHCLPGTTAGRAHLTVEERAALARPIARFLRVLHDLAPEPLVAAGVPHDEFGRVDFKKRVPVLRDRMAHIAAIGELDDPATFEPILRGVNDCATVTEVCPVHGDLYARHLLIGDNRKVSGVIDWGDFHIGDPAVDLAIAFGFLPGVARVSFLEAYGPVDERTEKAARFRALYSAVMIVAYGRAIEDEALIREGRFALTEMASDLSGSSNRV